MSDLPELESLYKEAQTAHKARDYDRAADLFKQVLVIDENYKDASRLLAQIVKFKRRRWYNDLRIWGPAVGSLVIGMLIWLVMNLTPPALFTPTPTATIATSPTTTLTPMMTAIPTITSSPTATPIPLAWRRISVGNEFPRDAINVILFDPKDPEVIYVGLNHAGSYKSIDLGQSWQPAHKGLGSASVSSLLIDPEQPSVLFALTNSGAYQTSDGGRSWGVFGMPWGGTPGFLLMDPQDSSHFYASNGTELYEKERGGPWKLINPDICQATVQQLAIHPANGNVLLARCSNALYRSENSGEDWISTGVDEVYGDFLWYQDDQGGTAIVSRYLIVPTYSIRLMISLDNGKTWEDLPNVAGGFDIAAALPDGVIALVGNYNGRPGFCKVTNQWQNYQRVSDPDLDNIRTIAVSPHDPDLIIAGGDGLAISMDGGRTWKVQSYGLGANLLHLQQSPDDTLIMYIQSISNIINPQITDVVPFRSTNGGVTWVQLCDHCGTIMRFTEDADGQTTYLLLRGGDQVRSSYDFENLTNINTPGDRYLSRGYLAPHPERQGEIYSFVYDSQSRIGKLLVSTNHGSDWLQYGPDSYKYKGGNMPSLYISWGQRIYLTSEQGIRYFDGSSSSTSCGKTGVLSLSFSGLSIDPQDENHLFLATSGEGVEESTDGCQSWRARSNGLGNLFINSISIDPNHPDTLYAGTDGGAYASYDGGESWTEINDGLLGALVVYSIVVDKNSNVYAATPYGIFKLEGR